MKKFIPDDDKLKKEIEKMAYISDMELMKKLFTKESQQLAKESEKIGREQGRNEGIGEGKEKIRIAVKMKKEQIDTALISKITELTPEEIEML